MWKIIALGIAIAIGGVAFMVWSANRHFDQQAEQEIGSLLAHGVSEGSPIREADLAHLPSPVRSWLMASGVLGQPIPRTIRLTQEGEIRLGSDKPWMPFKADQYYTIDPIAFIWRVSAKAPLGLFIRGVDSLQDGHGHMNMKPLALFSVVDAFGPTLDQGTALRYLQEIIWFPHAALASAISWQAIDAHTAQATLTLPTITVSGTFSFDACGHVVDFQAMRYRDEETLELWRTPVREHVWMDGIVVPTAGEGVWGSGDDAFSYIRVRILSITYDDPFVCP